MTRRKRIAIAVLFVVGLLLLLVWFWWFLLSGSSTPTPEVVIESAPVAPVEEVVPTRPTISEQELEAERETRNGASDVVALAKTFVARYGSYSNEADFANLKDVVALASVSFAAELQKTIDTAQAPEEYYGVSTQVVTVTIDEKDEEAGTAQVTITTQREEAIGSPQDTQVTYQDIVLTFVMEEGTWKVDSATWQ